MGPAARYGQAARQTREDLELGTTPRPARTLPAIVRGVDPVSIQPALHLGPPLIHMLRHGSDVSFVAAQEGDELLPTRSVLGLPNSDRLVEGALHGRGQVFHVDLSLPALPRE